MAEKSMFDDSFDDLLKSVEEENDVKQVKSVDDKKDEGKTVDLFAQAASNLKEEPKKDLTKESKIDPNDIFGNMDVAEDKPETIDTSNLEEQDPDAGPHGKIFNPDAKKKPAAKVFDPDNDKKSEVKSTKKSEPVKKTAEKVAKKETKKTEPKKEVKKETVMENNEVIAKVEVNEKIVNLLGEDKVKEISDKFTKKFQDDVLKELKSESEKTIKSLF